MKPIIIALLVLVGLTECLSQPIADKRRFLMLSGSGISHNPTPCIASFTDPSQIAGLALRWVASDLNPNANVSTGWVDRVQSIFMWQNTGAKQPTNSSNGVRFNGGQFLNVTNWTMTQAKDSLFIVWKMDTVSGADAWVVSHDASPFGRMNIAGGGGNQVSWTTGTLPGSWDISNFGKMDQEYSMGGAGGSAVTWYTNGVLVFNSAGPGFATTAFTVLGGSSASPANDINGSILEIAFYTNTTFTADTVCSLHYYATNHYGFTP